MAKVNITEIAYQEPAYLRKIGPKSMFLSAEAQHQAGLLLHESAKTLATNSMSQMRLAIIAVSHLALSFELFLKTLLFIQNNEPFQAPRGKGHDLLFLFNSLTKENQDKIDFHPFNASAHLPPAAYKTDLSPDGKKTDYRTPKDHEQADKLVWNGTTQERLERARKLYVTSRYFYEGKLAGMSWNCNGLLLAARARILELSPECADFILVPVYSDYIPH